MKRVYQIPDFVARKKKKFKKELIIKSCCAKFYCKICRGGYYPHVFASRKFTAGNGLNSSALTEPTK